MLISGASAAGCQPTTVTDAALIGENTGGLSIAANTISGSLTVNDNSGDAPFELNGAPVGPMIAGNTIGGVLACSGNNPAPIAAGQPNTATMGFGQCALETGLVS